MTRSLASKDPSRTSMLRKRFEREIIKRYNNLKKAVYQLIVVEDALGLKDKPKPTNNWLLDYVRYVFNFNPNQPRDYRGRWTSGGSSVGQIEQTIVSEGLADKADLLGLTVEEAQGVYEGLTSALVAGEHKLKLRGIQVKSEDVGHAFGYSNGYVSIYPKGVNQAREHRLYDVEEMFKDEPIGKRNFVGQASVDTQEYMRLSVAHEVGHHVDTALMFDPIKLPANTPRLSENDILPLSGYATIHPTERFAELHSAISTGRLDLVPPKLRQHYDDLLTTADADPIAVFLRPKLTANTRWKFRTSSQKLEEFRRWLQEQINLEIIPDEDDPIKQDEWWEKYVYEAYSKGVLRAFTDAQIRKLEENPVSYDARKEQFLRDSFVQPESAEKVKLLASRVFTDLKGVTDVMSQQMSRVLVEGLSRGANPLEIARELNDRVEHIGVTRSRVIARTEVLRAHNEGQLDALERLGVEEVGVAVEYDTADDGRVCKLCSAMEGVVLKIKESRGVLPRHPQCRCVWLPANVGEDTSKQIRSPTGIKKAFTESIKREIPAGSKRTIAEQKALSKWGGADAKISKNRPKSIV